MRVELEQRLLRRWGPNLSGFAKRCFAKPGQFTTIYKFKAKSLYFLSAQWQNHQS